MRTLYNTSLAQLALTSAARTNGTVNGTTIDTKVFTNAFHGVLFVVLTGAITDGSHAITIEDSDDASSWAAVNAAYVQGTQPTITSTNDDVVFHFGLSSIPKRYVRLKAVTSGATTGGIFAAVAVLGGASNSPPARA